MIHRYVLIFILCFNLAFPPESFAAANAVSPLSNLLIQHRDLKTGIGSMELLDKHGKNLSDTTFKLMNDPANQPFLRSPEGLELKKHQALLSNYLSIKDKFEKCIKDKEAKRKLHERILQSSFQGMINLDDSPCQPPYLQSEKSYENFSRSITKAAKKIQKSDFQTLLSKKIISNTARSLLGFRQKFQNDFMKSGKLTTDELDTLVNDVCIRKSQTPRAQTVLTDVCQKMDPSLKHELKKELIQFSETQKSNPKLTSEKILKSLNTSVDRLNKTLEKIELQNDIGFIYDSANLEDEKAKEHFNHYINQYTQEVSSEAGALLLTKTIKNKSGSIKRFDGDDTEKNKKTSKFQFTKHKKMNLQDVSLSIKEAESKMLAQARDTLNIANKNDGEDVADLVKINPFAAGQILIHQPEYASLVCDSINEINQNDSDDEDMDKYFMIGGAVIGGALVLTGVGAVAGAYLITGSLTAGLAAGTIGGSILGYSALAGGAIELVSAGYSSKRAMDHYQEMNQLESAYLTKNSDAKAITDARDALVNFKEARMMAAISLAGLGLNFVNLGSIAALLKGGNASKKELIAATAILNSISETKVALRLKEIMKSLGETGAETLDIFFLRLAKTGEAGRLKFLELLKNGQLTPEKYKEIIEASLAAAKNCSKV